MKTIIIKKLNIEVETRIHQKGKSFNKIKIPKGWRLLKMDEMTFLYNNYAKELNLNNTWEFIEQPFDKLKNKYASRFYACSGYANFYCGRDPLNSGSRLGVRFCRDLK